jgi:uncharacterized protein (TIGR03000 family)
MFGRLSFNLLGAVALAALLMGSGPSKAQVVDNSAGYTPNRYENRVIPDPEQALPDASGVTSWHSPYFHGYIPYDASPRRPPTYLTSINYPLVYGGYIYPFPISARNFDAWQRPFNAAPITYGDYYADRSTTWSLSTEAMAHSIPATLSVNSAIINISMPVPDASLTANGVRMLTTGLKRTYTVPDLIPTTTYTYNFTASWPQGGRIVTKRRSIAFKGGDVVAVDFANEPYGGSGTSVLRSRPLREVGLP